MKALVSSMIILGLITATPAFAEKSDMPGKIQAGGEQAQAYGKSTQQEGKGEMHQKHVKK